MATLDELLAMIRVLQGRANALEVRAGLVETDIANLKRQQDAADALIETDRGRAQEEEARLQRQARILRRRTG